MLKLVIYFCCLFVFVNSASAQQQCTGNDVYWSATAAGQSNGRFPILYQGFSFPKNNQQIRAAVAGCAGVQQNDVNVHINFGNRKGRVGIYCGQTFTVCG